MANLKPCPFCDGEAELDTSQAYRALSGGTLGSRAAVYCTRCGADMGFCYEDAPGTPREDIVNQVVNDWNRRAPSPDMREAVEALEFYAAPASWTNDEQVNRDEMFDTPVQADNYGDRARAVLRSLTGAKP
jgi:hypothetical protein